MSNIEMLPEQTINDHESVARIMQEMHIAFDKENVPMSDEQTRWSIQIMMASATQVNRMYNNLYHQHYLFAGFFERCNRAFSIKYEKRLLVWLAVMYINFGIGDIILIAYYVQWRAYLLKEKYVTFKNELEQSGELTLSMVCEKIFPLGIFTKDTVHEFWDKQKVISRPDNLIDYPKASMSFNPVNDHEPIVPY